MNIKKLLSFICSASVITTTPFLFVSCKTTSQIESNSLYCRITFSNEVDDQHCILTGPSSVQVKTNKLFGTVEKPIAALSGATFLYWAKKITENKVTTYEEIKASDPITENLTLYPIFDKEVSEHPIITFSSLQSDVTFEGKNPIILDSPNYSFGNISKPEPKKDGYHFVKWTDASGTEIPDSLSLKNDTTIYAQMEQDQEFVTITFSHPEGTTIQGEETVEVIKGSTFSTFNKPIVTKTGYCFEGWYNGSALIQPSTVFTTNTTLTPKFTLDVINSSEYYFWDENNVFWVYDKTTIHNTSGDIKATSITPELNGTTQSWSRSSFNKPIYIGKKCTAVSVAFLTNCSSFNQEIIIPDQVTTIADTTYSTKTNYGFLEGCSMFNSPITLSKNLKTIGNYFMYNCMKYGSGGVESETESVIVQKLIIPSSVSSIGVPFMEYCDNFNTCFWNYNAYKRNCIDIQCPLTAFASSASHFRWKNVHGYISDGGVPYRGALWTTKGISWSTWNTEGTYPYTIGCDLKSGDNFYRIMSDSHSW